MGQTSSQLEQPAASQMQKAPSSSPAPSVGTTASETLARDLERSVAESAKKQTSRPLKARQRQTTASSGDPTEEGPTTKSRKKSRAAELRDEATRDSPRQKMSVRRTAEAVDATGEDVDAAERPQKKRKTAGKDGPGAKEEPADSSVEFEEPPKRKKKKKARREQQSGQQRVENSADPLWKRTKEPAGDVRDEGHQSMVKGMVRVAEQPPPGTTAESAAQLDSDEDVDDIINGRELTADELQLEPEHHGPYRDDSEKFDSHRVQARNQLRAHLKGWEDEELVYRGRAKWKKQPDGEMYLKRAAPGKHFKDTRTESEKRTADLEAEARDNKIAACKRTLLAVIVRDERRKNPEAVPHGAEEHDAMDVDQDPAIVPAHIPTPPDSVEYDQANPVGNDAEDQVTGWLASQNEESPVPPDQLSPQPKSSRKRKRVSTFCDDDDEDFQLEADAVAPEDSNSVSTASREAAQAAKAAERKKKTTKETAKATKIAIEHAESSSEESESQHQQASKKSKSAVRVYASARGVFSAEEKETADRIFDEAINGQKLREAEMAAKIKDWKSCGSFRDNMYAAFPNRTKDSIRKFAQRRYHGMERGPWTEEQDEALRAANKLYPEQWIKISDHVGRTGADCKDRWRLQLQYRNKALGPWSVPEEEELLTAVEECIQAIKSEQSTDESLVRDRDRLEALISWKAVAKKLEGKRSTKRCREKYEKLKARKAKDENAAKGYGEGSTTRTNQHAKKAQSEKKEHDRMTCARRVVKESFELGDYYDVLMEIHSAFKDREQQFHDEGNVIWSIVSTKNLNSRFGMTFLASSLRRVVYENAITDFLVNAPKMTKRVEKAKTIPAKAFMLATWLEKQYSGRLQDMERIYMPELVGKSEEEISRIKKEKKMQKAEKRAQKSNPDVENGELSKDIVIDSENEDDFMSASDGDRPELSRVTSNDTDDENVKEIPETRGDAVDTEGSEAQTGADDGSDEDTSDNEEEEEDIADAKPVIPEPRPSPNHTPKIRSSWTAVNGTSGPQTLKKDSPTLGSSEFVKRCKKGGRRHTEQHGKRAAAKKEKRRSLED